MAAYRHNDGALPSKTKKQKPKVDGNIVDLLYGPKFGAKSQAPKPVFNKGEWLTGLTPEQKGLLKLEIETLDESWLAHLKDIITDDKFLKLKRFLQEETAAGRKWLPEENDVYSWSRHTPFDSVKIVIQGSCPYHVAGHSHGLAFSVQSDKPVTPSLRNIFRAVEADYPTFLQPPDNAGLLTSWANQGVLLLNTCLTVRDGQPFSHGSKGWEHFTQQIIDTVAQQRGQGVVFMAWGRLALRRLRKVSRRFHLVLEGHHPTPLSAFRGFFNCGHFRRANEWLMIKHGAGAEVDWALMPGTSTKEMLKTRPSVDEEGGRVNQEEKACLTAEEQSRMDPDDEKKKSGTVLDSFSIFCHLPPEIRHHIYLFATPPRFVQVQEWPPPSAEAFQQFEEWFSRTLPSQLPVHPSLAYFASTWRPYLLDAESRQSLASPPLRQARLDRYGFTTTAELHWPLIWEPSQECPYLDPLWLSEHSRLAWHLCRRSTLYSKAPIPALLHTCRDSRDFLIQYGYELAFATRSSPSQTWFHFKHDVLFFNGLNWDSPQLHDGHDVPWITGQFMPEHLQRIRRLALPFSSEMLFPFGEQLIHHILRLYPRIEDLFIVNSVLDDAVRRPWPGRGTNMERIFAQEPVYRNSDGRQPWEWVGFDLADAEAESLTWLGLGRVTSEMITAWDDDQNAIRSDPEELVPLLDRNFRQYFSTHRDRSSSHRSRPTVKLVNVGRQPLIQQLFRERQAYWQGQKHMEEAA